MKKLYVSKDYTLETEGDITHVRHLVQVYGADKAECNIDLYTQSEDSTKFIFNIEGNPGMVISDITSIEANGQNDLSLKITQFAESGKEIYHEELSDCSNLSEAQEKAKSIVSQYTSEPETAVINSLDRHPQVWVEIGGNQFEIHPVQENKYMMSFINNESELPSFEIKIDAQGIENSQERVNQLVVDLAELGDMKESIFEKYSSVDPVEISYDYLRADVDDIKDISRFVDDIKDISRFVDNLEDEKESVVSEDLEIG